NQTANVFYTLDDKDIFAAVVEHCYQNEGTVYQAAQDSIPVRGDFTQVNSLDPFNSDSDTFDTLEQCDRYNINKNKTVKRNKVEAKVDYYYVLKDMSNLNFTVGTTYSNQKFNSAIFQILDNGTQNAFTENDYNNDVTYTFTDAFFGLHYKLKSGKFIFTPGLTLHNYSLKNEQLGTTATQNDWMVLPDINVVLELK